MPQPAARPPRAPRRERTSTVVTLGMLALTLLGITAVFGEALTAALFPPADGASTAGSSGR